MKALMLAPALAMLAACSSAERARPAIPPQLLAPCEEPEWTGETNGDLVEYIAELREALGRCNADKEAIAAVVVSDKF